ncbi:MAG: hypothetical protein HOL85_04395 [Rhodospirillaceae bacterium]|nr:hypothetical protein [Rhodospirillaceae bacterium]MBT6135892.1 hypothetical protein [Rhodospirillaceae bacterium]
MAAPLVIVPVLAKAQSSARLLGPLKGLSSLQRTLRAALEEIEDAQVVVTTDDAAVADQARAFDARVAVHERTIEPYVPALHAVTEAYPGDIVVVLEPTHPFRPPGLVKRTAENLLGRDHLDSVVCVRRFKANLWRMEPDQTISAMGEGGAGPSPVYYQELIGLGLATRRGMLAQGRRLGDAVGFEVVDEFWTLVDIHDDTNLAVAELIADHIEELRNTIS